MLPMIGPKPHLPNGASEEELLNFLGSLPIGLPPWPRETVSDYYKWHFKRFLHTYDLAEGLKGRCLELGAAPYFMTIILRQFTNLDLALANYFGPDSEDFAENIFYRDFFTGKERSLDLDYHYFNIEGTRFPFRDAEFDVVLFCEIIEHLFADPLSVLKEIKRVLKPGGTLILTTPNAARLENVAKMIAGINVYHPYSGYWGPYGRHNREYTLLEIIELLDHCGFAIEEAFTADVKENRSEDQLRLAQLEPLLSGRIHDLGQSIFIRAKNVEKCQGKRPSFLFMNYPPGELIDINAEFPKENDILSIPSAIFLKEWHSCEDWNGSPARWMGNEAAILVPSEINRLVKINLLAISFHLPRNMEIYADGVLSHTALVSIEPTRIFVEMRLMKGISTIMFKSIEGCERPCDIAELENKDQRCLSFAIQDISIT
jgi:SAM-dependent methyltransferase